jgi:hypothetical protein
MTSPSLLTAESLAGKRIASWLDLMHTTDKLLLAGLRYRIGPEGDLQAAYRQWYADHMRDHDEAVQRVAARLRAADQEPRDGG